MTISAKQPQVFVKSLLRAGPDLPSYAPQQLWPVRLSVRTPGFQPGKRGSIPLRAATLPISSEIMILVPGAAGRLPWWFPRGHLTLDRGLPTAESGLLVSELEFPRFRGRLLACRLQLSLILQIAGQINPS